MRKMPLRKLWSLILIASVPAMGRASVDFASARTAGGQTPLVERERHVWNSAVHDSEFAAIPQTASRIACAATQLPQALATPDPLLEEADLSSKVSVSFIIGTDGRVHSALILESAGPNEDRTILDAVRFWRYRPALCNGVPTDAEAKVEFSSR
jgi:TonB family protein